MKKTAKILAVVLALALALGLAACGSSNGGAEEAKAEMVEFDLSDITHNEQEKSREDIIAEAEAQAFAE